MYKDNILLFSSKFIEQKEYWISKLSGDITECQLVPLSKPTGTGKNQPTRDQRKTVEMILNHSQRDLAADLIKLSKKNDLALYIILFAALKFLTYRYTGKEDIIVATPVNKRKITEETLNNCLFIRSQVTGATTFKEAILSLKATVLQAHSHQDYPAEKIIEYLFDTTGPLNNNPLSNIVCSMENIHDDKNIKELTGTICFLFAREEKEIRGWISYDSHIFEKYYIENISRHFVRILEKAAAGVNIPLAEISFLTEPEKKQLLIEFNNTHTAYPADKTVHRLFAEQAARNPDRTAIIGMTARGYGGILPSGEWAPPTQERWGVSGTRQWPIHLTYKQLNAAAQQMACLLTEKGVTEGSIAAVKLGHSIEVVIAFLAILKAGAAYLSIDPQYPENRIDYMLKDSGAKILLTGKELSDFSSPQAFKIRPQGTSAFGIWNLEFGISSQQGGQLAYLIYTSGSTGKPKGVLVEHKSIIRLVKNTNYFRFTSDTRLLQSGALEFDASTFEIWGPLLNSSFLCLMDKNEMLMAETLRTTIERHRINVMWMTSGLFNHMFDSDMEIFKGFKHLLAGGDVISTYRINRLREKFPQLTVINGYGPTENTTFSVCCPIKQHYEGNIPIGKPISNSTTYILDKYMRPQPVGAVGELWVGGDGVARGYLNNPELTFERFINYKLQITNPKLQITNKTKTFSPHSPHSLHSPIYKTGDMGRWLKDGNIEFLGRMDLQVKIRGFRIEPGEIENRLLEIEHINKCVVQAFQDTCHTADTNNKYLCAYVVGAKKIDIHELRNMISAQLPDYMVPSFFVQLEKIPLTPNRKIDRHLLPKPEITAGDEYIAPRNDTEKKLAKIFAKVLKIDDSAVGIDSNFFELGGHSLKATILGANIHKELNVKIPLAEIFTTQTIRELSGYIKATREDRHTEILPVEKKEFYALSPAQKRLYILQQLEPGSTAYNVFQFIPLTNQVDMRKLSRTFLELIARHESLRTSIEMINDEPVQRIHEPGEMDFQIGYYQSANREKMLFTNFIRPFDVSQVPSIRVELLKTGEEHTLLIDMHHIITDGTSQNILIREFTTLYPGEQLAPLRLQYKDYSQWRNSEEQQVLIKRQETYWLDLFTDDLPILDLPTDFPRPLKRNFAGEVARFTLNRDETKHLKNITKKIEATLYMSILSVFTILLSKLSGQEDIIVGTPIAGRRHTDLEHIVGMFVNTLPMRNYPEGEKTFAGFLKEVKERTLAAFENQDYQLEDLVARVTEQRDASRNPLFDVLLTSPVMDRQTGNIPGINISGRRVTPWEIKKQTAKFDIILHSTQVGDTLLFTFEYSTQLFKKNTIERFSDYFKEIVSTIIKNPGKKIGDIDIIRKEKRDKIIEKIREEKGESIKNVEKNQYPPEILEAEFDY